MAPVLSCILALQLLLMVPGLHSLPSPGIMRERRLASNCVSDIYVFAHTSTQGPNPGTNGEHGIEIRANGVVYSSFLRDYQGDQTTPGKGDLWKLNLITDFRVPSESCIRNRDIDYIVIKEGSNDSWRIDSIITVFKLGGGSYEVATLDMDVHQWIGNPDVQEGVARRFALNRI